MSQSSNCNLCLSCRNLLINRNIWNKQDSIRKYCGVTFPHKNLSELNEINNCSFYTEKNQDKTILVFGASGLVGGSIYREFNCYNGFRVFGTYNFNKAIDDLICIDLTQISESLEIIREIKPDIIIWAAENEYSRPDNNIRRTFIEMLQIINTSTKFVFFSSDTVFSGSKGNYSEKDTVCIPEETYYLHDYISSKLEREEMVRSLKNHIIIRTGPVYGKNLTGNWDFRSERIFSDICHRSTVSISDNSKRSFIHNDFLASSVLRLVEKDFSGTIHLSCGKARYTIEHYKDLAEYNGFDRNLVISDKEADAEKQKDLSLDNSLFISLDKNLSIKKPDF